MCVFSAEKYFGVMEVKTVILDCQKRTNNLDISPRYLNDKRLVRFPLWNPDIVILLLVSADGVSEWEVNNWEESSGTDGNETDQNDTSWIPPTERVVPFVPSILYNSYLFINQTMYTNDTYFRAAHKLNY